MYPRDVNLLLVRLQAALDGGPTVFVGDLAGGLSNLASRYPDAALVLSTSGSTGTPRAVALSSAALRASTRATHQRLAGPGHWLLTLPPDHIAGIQVLIRSLMAGIAPESTGGGPFDPRDLTTAIDRMRTDVPRYVSLVPTQLVRTLAHGGDAVAALGSCAAVLVGAAATSTTLLQQARVAGIAVVTSYGMTETCGGCVYDGVPLDGVSVRLGENSRIEISGPVLAEGYLPAEQSTDPSQLTSSFHLESDQRWLRTTDAGAWADGLLTVTGRLDDVLVTGGVNVHPAEVERAISGAAGVRECMVVGVPEARWGTLVTAVVVGSASLAQLRERVGGGPLAPRALVQVGALPHRGVKVDRRAATALAIEAVRAGRAEVHHDPAWN